MTAFASINTAHMASWHITPLPNYEHLVATAIIRAAPVLESSFEGSEEYGACTRRNCAIDVVEHKVVQGLESDSLEITYLEAVSMHLFSQCYHWISRRIVHHHKTSSQLRQYLVDFHRGTSCRSETSHTHAPE